MASTGVKRLAPTAETARRLFLLSGNQCAFPDCIHPIIIKDGTYVGEICHICAAEQGGERFIASMTNEDRRHFDNLIIMCHDHHVVTDDVDLYPIERMRQLKSDHESRFTRGLANMMESANIQIVDSIIVQGGEGGKAPGAGGGGGGAYGPNAIGGAGGAGGADGAGGSGGSGGSAASIVRGLIDVTEGRDPTQEILQVLETPRIAGEIKTANITMAFLANRAELINGLLYLLGADWKSFFVEQLPQSIAFSAAFFVVVEPSLREDFVVSLVDPTGIQVASATKTFDSTHDGSWYVFHFVAFAKEPGSWHVSFSNGQREVRRLPFEIQLQRAAFA